MTGPAIAGTPTTIFGTASSISQGGPYCCEAELDCNSGLEFSITTPTLLVNTDPTDGDCYRVEGGAPLSLSCTPCSDVVGGATVIAGNGTPVSGSANECDYESSQIDETCIPDSGCPTYPTHARWEVRYVLENDECLKNVRSSVSATLRLTYSTQVFDTLFRWSGSKDGILSSGDLLTLPYASGPNSSPGTIAGYRCYLNGSVDLEVEVL